MGQRPSCRSCRHCTPPSGVEMGWCQLRELPIHAELVTDLWCHHWTARPARLPVMAPPGGSRLQQTGGGNRQLSLGALLPQT
jgi:hypothetical protein